MAWKHILVSEYTTISKKMPSDRKLELCSLVLLGNCCPGNVCSHVSGFLHSASRGGAEREGDTEPEAGSRLRAVSTEPDMGLELTYREIMT